MKCVVVSVVVAVVIVCGVGLASARTGVKPTIAQLTVVPTSVVRGAPLPEARFHLSAPTKLYFWVLRCDAHTCGGTDKLNVALAQIRFSRAGAKRVGLAAILHRSVLKRVLGLSTGRYHLLIAGGSLNNPSPLGVAGFRVR